MAENQEATDNGAKGASTESQDSKEPYVYTYKDKETAEKGIRDKDLLIEDLKEQIEQRDEKMQQQQLLQKIASKLDAPQQQEQIPDKRAALKSIAEEINQRVSEGEGVGEKILDLMTQYLTEADADFTKKATGRYAKLEEKLQSATSKLREQLLERDPDFVARRDKVLAIEKLGIDREKALEIVKAVVPPPEQPPRPPLPGTSSTNVTAFRDEGSVLSDADVKLLESVPGIGTLSDQEKELLKKRGAR